MDNNGLFYFISIYEVGVFFEKFIKFVKGEF